MPSDCAVSANVFSSLALVLPKGRAMPRASLASRTLVIPMSEAGEVSQGACVVAGARLRWRAVGVGSPLVLLHSVPGDMETLAPVADALADICCEQAWKKDPLSG